MAPTQCVQTTGVRGTIVVPKVKSVKLNQIQVLHQQNVHLDTAAAIALVKIYAKMSAKPSRPPLTTAFGVVDMIHPFAINQVRRGDYVDYQRIKLVNVCNKRKIHITQALRS